VLKLGYKCGVRGIFKLERADGGKNYNNVQVIFIRVETEAKRRKKNIKKISREWGERGRKSE
jgi:hypothetical protein